MVLNDDGDFFQEGDDVPDEAPTWHPPVKCPKCYSDQTRFVALKYEMSVYVCEICNIQFEEEE